VSEGRDDPLVPDL
jgi:hypothetical protein